MLSIKEKYENKYIQKCDHMSNMYKYKSIIIYSFFIAILTSKLIDSDNIYMKFVSILILLILLIFFLKNILKMTECFKFKEEIRK